MSLQHLWNATFEHFRKDRIANEKGGFSEEFTSLGKFRGRLNPLPFQLRSAQRVIAQQERGELTHVIYCSNVAAKVNDEFEVDGRRFRCIVPLERPSVKELYTKIFLMEIQI